MLSRMDPPRLSRLYLLSSSLSRGRRNSGYCAPKLDDPQASSNPHPNSEDYFKDVDDSPPQDPSLYKVDAASEAAQRPHEPPSGPWSRAGMRTEEYQTVSKEEPYDIPAPGAHGLKLRYGGRKRYYEEKEPETSKSDEGPDGSQRWGRMSEGRK
ncbi:hypothetical protein F5I97DRAFT_1858642 [Phlebopus sp. FC_14]|nr:hypothetical protein F5I97DRAFT_1858642 [Phlebopus sp. FC_14]